jgi:type IV pilus assembly protein PilB
VFAARRGGAADRRLFGDLLIEAGLVSREGLASGLEAQRVGGGRIGFNLLRLGLVTPADFYLFLRDTVGVLSPDLAVTLATGPAVDLLPARLAHQHGVVPIRVEDGALLLAIADADNPTLLKAIEDLTGLRVDPVICPPSLIAAAIDRFYPSELEPGVWFRAFGDAQLAIADRRRGIRAPRLESIRPDAPSSHWLRALGGEAIRRGARAIRLEPRRRDLEATFVVLGGARETVRLPAGVHAGVGRLIEGLARLGSRGRVVPRDGRITWLVDDRRIAVSVRALPGIDGDGYTLDLRSERLESVGAGVLAADLPPFAAATARIAAEGHGLVLLAATSPIEARAGLAAFLALLDGRRPKRAGIGDWAAGHALPILAARSDEEEVPSAPLLARAMADDPEILVLPWIDGPEWARAATFEARDRIVVAPVAAADAPGAAARMRQSGIWGVGSATGGGGDVLAVRAMERLCSACRRPCDPSAILSTAGAGSRMERGDYFVSHGCPECRGSGTLALEPVLEYLPLGEAAGAAGAGAAGGPAAGGWRRPTSLFRAGLRKAADGCIDAREPIRFLLHEQS